MKNMLLVVALLGLAVLYANAQLSPEIEPLLCFEEGWKLTYTEMKGDMHMGSPSFGTFFDEDEEYFWVHSDQTIDFYSVTDKSNFGEMESPMKSFSIDAGSTCAASDSLDIGGSILSFHDVESLCACEWAEDFP